MVWIENQPAAEVASTLGMTPSALYVSKWRVLKRLREESPLYYNDKHDFYALSLYDDVKEALSDKETFSSARGAVLEFIKSNAPIPSGVFIFEDPPLHTIHRGLLTRVFTPKKMSALEPLIREYCAKALDPLVGGEKFDDLAAYVRIRLAIGHHAPGNQARRIGQPGIELLFRPLELGLGERGRVFEALELAGRAPEDTVKIGARARLRRRRDDMTRTALIGEDLAAGQIVGAGGAGESE